jgi:aminopeptidase N
MHFRFPSLLPLASILLLTSCTLFLSKEEKTVLKNHREGKVSLIPKDSDETAAIDFENFMKGLNQQEPPKGRKVYDVYNPSATRIIDIIHTRLEVDFNFDTQQLNGKAIIELKPYFNTIDSVILEGKAFDIKSIDILEKAGASKPLNYTYKNNFIRIGLDRKYSRNETLKLNIVYTANPEKVTQSGSEAITSAKGLYFINPKGKEKNKPTQIWTQGETESNSCWFPTIDKPNEKMTHEILITVPKKYKTLSNGLLISSKEDKSGNRTDYWKMDQPHAPYLVMMAIGEYAVVKDKWRNIVVDYYVEPEYEAHARKIFGNTPEMLEFFSKKLGVDYPWPKYSQIVVRDYVSGAMENTSATIHGEFLQQTPQQMIDYNYEDIIAHELFHHWFGDLVTCESWANLPLNESFATYGEYIWNEYKYGRDAADYHRQSDLSNYFQEAFTKKVDLIRYDYKNKEDMFDRHSYQKGGLVLHMLRKYLGDEVFFESLKTYLNDNKFQPAEIHHLRLAFEKVSGEDLNWFFNQWFLDRGHPNVNVQTTYSQENQNLTITLKQTHDKVISPVYKLVFDVDIYVGGTKRRERIVLERDSQEVIINNIKSKPDLVNIDGERQLLGVLNHEKSVEELKFQFYNAPLYADRFEAIDQLGEKLDEPGVEEVIKSALMDPFHRIRQLALEILENRVTADPAFYKQRLTDLAQKDKKSSVRRLAIEVLSNNFTDASLETVYEKAISDSSLMVKGQALRSLIKINPDKGKALTSQFEGSAEGELLSTIFEIYAQERVQGKFGFMKNSLSKITNSQEKYGIIQSMGKYALAQTDGTVEESLPYFTMLAKTESPWYIRLSAMQVLAEMKAEYDEIAQTAYETAYELKKNNGNQAQILQWETKAEQANQFSKLVLKSMEEVRDAETDANLKRIYGVLN